MVFIYDVTPEGGPIMDFSVIEWGDRGWHVQWSHPDDPSKRIRRACFLRNDPVPPSRRTRKRATERARTIYNTWLEEENARPDEDGLRLSDLIALAKVEKGVPRIGNKVSPSTLQRRAEILDYFEEFLTGVRKVERRSNAPQLPGVKVRRNGRLVGFGPDGLVCEVHSGHLEEYIYTRQERVRTATVERELAVIRRAFNYALEHRKRFHLPSDFENPVLHKSRRPNDNELRQEIRRKAFTEAECSEILRACDDGYTVPCEHVQGDKTRVWSLRKQVEPFLATAIRIAYHTGMRRGEILNLRWDAVDFESGLLHIQTGTSKTGARELPMTSQCEEVLRNLHDFRQGLHVVAYDDGSPATASAVRQGLKRLLRKLNISSDWRAFHGFRHAYGLRWAERVSVHKLKKAMGHKNIATTMLYLDVEVRELVQEFRMKETS